MFDAWVLRLVLAAAIQAPIVDLATPLERLRRIDAEIYGRDPCHGTGLCCKLLPVHGQSDVDSVVFPSEGMNISHLKLLGEFPNIREVRIRRYISELEFATLIDSVPKDTALSGAVKQTDGTVLPFYKRSKIAYIIDPTTGKPTDYQVDSASDFLLDTNGK